MADVSVGWDAAAGVSEDTVKTDAAGRYTLRGVTPGERHVFAMPPPVGGAPSPLGPVRKTVKIASGQKLTSVDFQLTVPAELIGTVLDDNDHPVPGVYVVPLRRAYAQGRLRYATCGRAGRTDKLGRFRALVDPETPIILAAGIDGVNPHDVEPISRVAEAPSLRRPVTIATYYPDSARPDGALVMTLASGEKREHVIVHLQRSRSICIDGTILTPAGPAAMDFAIWWRDAESHDCVGAFRGTTGSNGKFRVCDLHAGSYRIEASEPVARESAPRYFGAAGVDLVDRDVRDIRIAAQDPSPVRIEVVPDGGSAGQEGSKLTVYLLRYGARSPAEGLSLRRTLPIPGAGSVPLFSDAEYSVGVSSLTRISSPGNGWYVKDVTYGGASLRNQPLRPNSAAGEASLWVTLGSDGGYISARVTDTEGNPASANVAIIPQLALPDAELSNQIVFGMTDDAGRFTSAMLAPGRYHVIAGTTATGSAPDFVTAWLGARSEATEVEVNPGGNVAVALHPVRVM